ncbi:MAG TPA: hypothetical protein VFX70_19715 [Mycobacteriales bacterium]|nr:hypothetical protein [Mycobacteriales bacterium]
MLQKPTASTSLVLLNPAFRIGVQVTEYGAVLPEMDRSQMNLPGANDSQCRVADNTAAFAGVVVPASASAPAPATATAARVTMPGIEMAFFITLSL